MKLREILGMTLLGIGVAGCPPPEGNVAPPKQEDIYYMTRPLLTWPHQGGRRYSLSLSQAGDFRVGAGGQRIPNVLMSKADYEQGTWRPDFDLRWNKSYMLRIITRDEEGRQMELPVPFRIAYEVATLTVPAPNSMVASIEPYLGWQRAAQPGCRYHFQLSERDDFGSPIADADHLPGYYVHLPGPDAKFDTPDDVHTIYYQPPNRVLEPQKSYYWRVRTIYYQGEPTPASEVGRGEWSPTSVFRCAPQPDMSGELLDTVIRVTDSPDAEINPAISVNEDLVCQRQRSPGGGLMISEIILIRARKDEAGTVGYERGIQQVTTALSTTEDWKPTWDEKGEGVFFHSNRADNQFNVWYTRLSRRGLEQLTTTRYGAFAPTVAPDGSRVAYQANDESGGPSIWLMNRDGSRPTQVVGGRLPCWSPDGTQLAYQVEDKLTRTEQIWMMQVDGLEKTQLTSQGSNQQPAWSPDGRLIAYASDRSGNWDIRILDPQTGTELTVTNYLGTDRAPAWSPDGRRLAFQSTRNTREFNIWVGTVKR